MTRERKNYTPGFLMSLSQLKSALAGLKARHAFARPAEMFSANNTFVVMPHNLAMGICDHSLR